MKLFCILSLLSLFIFGCAHEAPEPPKPVEIHGTVEGIHIKVNEFLALTAFDLHQLEENIKSAEEKDLVLSSGQTARCHEGVCHLAKKDFDGEINSIDLQKFTTTLKKAQKSNSEQRFVDAPVTLRCTPVKCVADFNLDDDRPHKFNGAVQVRGQTDVPGYLLSGFVSGLVGAAHGSNR